MNGKKLLITGILCSASYLAAECIPCTMEDDLATLAEKCIEHGRGCAYGYPIFSGTCEGGCISCGCSEPQETLKRKKNR